MSKVTKVLILLSPDFRDMKKFRLEFSRAIRRFSNGEEWKDYEYVYYDTINNNEIIKNSLDLLGLKQNIFPVAWEDANSVALNFNKIFGYVIEAENSIIIDFQDTYGFEKHKKKIYKQYSEFLNIYLVYFSIDSDPLTCCNQVLLSLNEELDIENDTFDFLECDICGNKYVIFQELLDEYMVKTMYVTIIHRKSFFKGEFE